MDMYDAKQLYDRLKVSEREDGILDLAVSYTHLTLPTKLEV